MTGTDLTFPLVAFAVTNVDDLVLLTLLFQLQGTGREAVRRVTVGQYLGMGVLVVVSLLAATGLSTVPDRWVRLLGLIPLGLGLLRLVRGGAGQESVTSPQRTVPLALLVVSAGGDNIAIYTAGFHRADAAAIVWTCAVFATLTGVWCLFAVLISRRLHLVRRIRGAASRGVPLLYVAIGLRVLLAG